MYFNQLAFNKNTKVIQHEERKDPSVNGTGTNGLYKPKTTAKKKIKWIPISHHIKNSFIRKRDLNVTKNLLEENIDLKHHDFID